jgi:aarF domain-containing kinase
VGVISAPKSEAPAEAEWRDVCADGPDPGEAGLVEPLGAVLTQLSKGGGARGINIDDVTRQLEDLTREYPFQIPSYFALILRAFSVIEGIALRVDPGYSIVQECFPYIARRLLTDNHPRTRSALRQLLYAVRARCFFCPLICFCGRKPCFS